MRSSWPAKNSDMFLSAENWKPVCLKLLVWQLIFSPVQGKVLVEGDAVENSSTFFFSLSKPLCISVSCTYMTVSNNLWNTEWHEPEMMSINIVPETGNSFSLFIVNVHGLDMDVFAVIMCLV